MKCLTSTGRFGRRIPLWIRCAAFGLVVSWFIALGHWVLVETGQSPRLTDARGADADASGVTIVEALHRKTTGLPPRRYDPPAAVLDYDVVAYGWPVANWGTIFRQRPVYIWQTGVDPIVGVNVRSLWPSSDLPDPRNQNITPQYLATALAAGECVNSNATDPYQRYLPVYPLIGQSMLASLVYGAPLFACFAWRDRRRGGCHTCGYRLEGIASDAPCPECGKARKPISMLPK
jgi:hypothetical protein